MTTVNRALLLLALIAAGAIVWMVRDMFTPVPFEIQYKSKQVDGLIAMARADTIGLPIDDRCRGQKAVVRVALRRQNELKKKDKKAEVSFVQMLHTCSTFYPKDWKFDKSCFRSVWVIWGSPRYKGSPWDDVKKCVLDELKATPKPEGCADLYTREEKRYENLTDEEKAAEVIESTFELDPSEPPIGAMKFFCSTRKKKL